MFSSRVLSACTCEWRRTIRLECGTCESAAEEVPHARSGEEGAL